MTTLTTDKNELLAEREIALAKFLNCSEYQLSYKGEMSFQLGDKEYLVLTEDEAVEKSCVYIEKTLWAFRASWLINFIPSAYSLSQHETNQLEKCIAEMQSEMCESCNDILKALIGKDLKDLINAALCNDPMEYFLAPYDHKVAVEGEFLIYRTN